MHYVNIMILTLVIILIVCLVVSGYLINKRRLVIKGSSNDLRFGELMVSSVDLNKYAGKWYEISRLPNYYEKGCNNPTAIYSLNNNGTMNIVNQCNVNNNNSNKTVSGTAYPSYPSLPITNQIGRFQVYFTNIPIPGEYNIIYIDSNYEYAMVGTTDRQSLWLLSRSNQVNPEKILEMRKIAEIYGYPIDKLIQSTDKLLVKQ